MHVPLKLWVGICSTCCQIATVDARKSMVEGPCPYEAGAKKGRLVATRYVLDDGKKKERS
jgi:hypothetical protein